MPLRREGRKDYRGWIGKIEIGPFFEIRKASIENRDLLFISYATEDIPFSDWLALKLTGLGYRVWYDRMTLLAGQSFVKEVDEAIGKRTFRFLGILSRNSVNKENPTNERTKAIAVGKSLNIDDFVITLNIDGLPASDIPWTLSQKSYASFHPSWADGLKQLIKTLEARNTPCDPSVGRDLVCQWTSAKDQPQQRNERVWTNLISVVSVPPVLRQYELKNEDERDVIGLEWPFAIQNKNLVWAFQPPPEKFADRVIQQRATSWLDASGPGFSIANAGKYLLRKSVEDFAIAKGLVRSPGGETTFFPKGLLQNDKHFFMGLFGKRTHVKLVGERTFRVGAGNTEINHHHLAPAFKLIEREGRSFQIQLINRLYITGPDGNAIHPSRMLRRRKKICKNWWNDKWGSRLLAVMSWLSDDQDEIEIFKTPEGSFKIAGRPLALQSEFGIQEDESPDPNVVEDAPEVALDDMESNNPIQDYGDAGDEEATL